MRDTYRFGLDDHTQPHHPDYQRYRQTQAWFLNQLKVYPHVAWAIIKNTAHHIPTHVVHENHVAIARMAPDFYMYAYYTEEKLRNATQFSHMNWRAAQGAFNHGWPDLATMQRHGILWPHNDLPNNFPMAGVPMPNIVQAGTTAPPPTPKIDYAAITRSIVGR